MFKCYHCGHFQRDPGPCEVCGSQTVYYPDEPVDFKAAISSARGARGVWRFAPLLPPVKREVTLGEGATPMISAERLGPSLGLRQLYIKNESINPTGSYLDRGSAVSVSHAAALNYQSILCGYPGNLSASLAAYAARAGLSCLISGELFTNLGKLYQTLAYGARYYQRNGQEAEAYRGGEGDPYFLSGLKTLAYELFEDVGDSFDYVVMSVGEGGGISMVYAGLSDLHEAGLIKRLPRLIGVKGEEGSADDLVETGMHKRLYELAIRVTEGATVTVTRQETVEALRVLARAEGLFAEPASAVALAGLIKAMDGGLVERGSRVVYVLTGTGLKDPISIGILLGLSERREGAGELSELAKAVLRMLYMRSMHGYEIWKELRSLGMERTLPMVYVTLKELREKGLITYRQEVQRGRSVKRYALTGSGRRLVELFYNV